MAQATYEVHLAIYDLSRGMARSLSGQFLGPDHTLDIIPHTGIVVYGKEYFYGGGIQSANPASFRQSMGIHPIDTQLLGRTTVSQHEFEQWCQNCMRNVRYTMDDYDLIQRNCNNFCHDAALEGLRLPNGVPEWILDVPQRFLASPMGQMVRPMLEQMQVTGGGSAAPFAGAAAPVTAPAPQPAAAANANPWANMPSTTAPIAASTSNGTSSNKVKEDLKTPVLDSHSRPLLSNDTKTASLCAKKLVASTEDENDKTALKDVGDKLSSGAKPTDDVVEASSKAILNQLDTSTNVTFALMLLRLIMLHPSETLSETSSYTQSLKWVQGKLCQEEESFSTPAARSMAWCTLSNAYGTASATITPTSLERAVEAALGDLVPDKRVEVRQAAAAFLYNVSLVESSAAAQDEELPDLIVTLLCGCLDGVSLETDDTTKMRRLLVAARICSASSSARSLVKDLGFAEALHDGPSNGDDKVGKLTKELISILDS